MPVYPDLSPDPTTNIRMIGYLGDRPYREGEVEDGFLEKLAEVEKWGLIKSSPGHHTCVLCHEAESSSEHIAGDYQWPDMLTHYVHVHHYQPSQEFISFVMGAKEEDFLQPLPRTITYPDVDF